MSDAHLRDLYDAQTEEWRARLHAAEAFEQQCYAAMMGKPPWSWSRLPGVGGGPDSVYWVKEPGELRWWLRSEKRRTPSR
jgi:hypothetical protein